MLRRPSPSKPEPTSECIQAKASISNLHKIRNKSYVDPTSIYARADEIAGFGPEFRILSQSMVDLGQYATEWQQCCSHHIESSEAARVVECGAKYEKGDRITAAQLLQIARIREQARHVLHARRTSLGSEVFWKENDLLIRGALEIAREGESVHRMAQEINASRHRDRSVPHRLSRRDGDGGIADSHARSGDVEDVPPR